MARRSSPTPSPAPGPSPSAPPGAPPSIQDLAAQLAGTSPPTSSSTDVGNLPVWGLRATGGYDQARDALIPGRVHRTTITVNEAVGDWYTWSELDRQAWAQRAYQLGLIKDPNDYGAAADAWVAAVREAGKFYGLGKKKVTPWDALEIMGNADARAEANKPKTTVSKSRQFNIPSRGDAETAIKQIFQGALGRDPTDAELSRYSSILVSKAKANPQVTTTRTTTDAQGNTSSQSTTSGGYNATQTLQEPVQQTDEYGAYQAATTLFNALAAAIGNPG